MAGAYGVGLVPAVWRIDEEGQTVSVGQGPVQSWRELTAGEP